MTRHGFGGFGTALEPHGFGQTWTSGPGFGSHPSWSPSPHLPATGPWLYGRGLPGFGPHRGKGPRGYRRSDERIADDIVTALTLDPVIDAGNLEIAVSSGDVTLSGSVPERWMRRYAEQVVEDCLGVRDVFNRIRVDERAERGQDTWRWQRRRDLVLSP